MTGTGAKPAVSVIIPAVRTELQSNKELNRCLESIKRQTFTDYELILCTDEEEAFDGWPEVSVYRLPEEALLSKLLAQAAGSYVFFCSATSVLTENVLETLMDAERDGTGTHTAVPVLCRDGAHFFAAARAQFGLYSCLWRKEELASFQECTSVQPATFDAFVQIRTVESAQVYETDPAGVFTTQSLKPEPLTEWLDLLCRLVAAGQQTGKDVSARQTSGDTAATTQTAVQNAAQTSADPAGTTYTCTEDYMYGQELVRFTVRKYAQGQLGLKTLFQSLRAWLWFKFKRH